MKYLAYSIIRSVSDFPSEFYGIWDCKLRMIHYKDIAVIASLFDEEQFENKRKLSEQEFKEMALRYEETIEQLMTSYTLLPFRFLTFFENEENIFRFLEKRYSSLNENLNNVSGRSEYGLKIIWKGEEIKENISNDFKHAPLADPKLPLSGKEFLRQKYIDFRVEKSFREIAERKVEQINSQLEKYSDETKIEILRTDNLLLSAYYLIPTENEKIFKETYQKLLASLEEVKYLVSGPWPPYNFIENNLLNENIGRDQNV